jgi:hypothetical protein
MKTNPVEEARIVFRPDYQKTKPVEEARIVFRPDYLKTKPAEGARIMFRPDYLDALRRKVSPAIGSGTRASFGLHSSVKTMVCPRHAEKGRRDAGAAVR